MSGAEVVQYEPAELARPEQQQLVRLDTKQIEFLARTEFVPERIRGNLPAIFATIATGREIGIGDMAALRHVHIVDGKPGYSAEIMCALVRQHKHSITGTVGDGVATVTGKRADSGDTITVEWTRAMAERAGLLGKQNWKRYEESMLWARAVSQLCRMLFPDCTAGFSYTAEELEDSGVETPATATVVEGGESAGLRAGGDLGREASQPPSATAEPVLDDVGVTPPAGTEPMATPGQKKKLDVLVKGEKRAPVRRVWVTVAAMRGIPSDRMDWFIGQYDGALTDDGVLHWSPLRDSLTDREAGQLIDRLEKLEAQP